MSAGIPLADAVELGRVRMRRCRQYYDAAGLQTAPQFVEVDLNSARLGSKIIGHQ